MREGNWPVGSELSLVEFGHAFGERFGESWGFGPVGEVIAEVVRIGTAKVDTI